VTDAEARAALARMCAATSPPPLTADDMTALVDIARRPDGTYNLNRAAAEGWRWKAGRIAGNYNLSIDGTTVNKGDLLDHCERMVKMYSRGGVALVRMDMGEPRPAFP